MTETSNHNVSLTFLKRIANAVGEARGRQYIPRWALGIVQVSQRRGLLFKHNLPPINPNRIS